MSNLSTEHSCYSVTSHGAVIRPLGGVHNAIVVAITCLTVTARIQSFDRCSRWRWKLAGEVEVHSEYKQVPKVEVVLDEPHESSGAIGVVGPCRLGKTTYTNVKC